MKVVMMSLFSLVMAAEVAVALPTQNQDWDQIRAADGVAIHQGPLAKNFGAQGFFNACVNGDTLNTIQPVSTCVAWETSSNGEAEGEGQASVCTKKELRHVSLPRTQTSVACVKWTSGGGQEDGKGSTCLQYEERTVQIPASFNFDVHTYWVPGCGQENFCSDDGLLFRKAYTLPTCEL
jgi:hypothetical protein